MSFLTYLRRDLEQIFFKDRDPHAIPSMDGAFSPNDRLDRATPIGEPLMGADAVAEAPDGAICVSAGNKIWRLSGRGYRDRAVLAEFDSRVGALMFDREGHLFACTARGLAVLDGAGKTIKLVTQAEGEPLHCLTAIAAGPDGTIFISDGSTRHGAEDWRVDLMEGNRLGRIVACGRTLRRCPRAAARAELSGRIGGNRRPPLVHRKLRPSYEPCTDHRARHNWRTRGRDPKHAGLSVEAGARPAPAASGSASSRCVRIWSSSSCARTISATR